MVWFCESLFPAFEEVAESVERVLITLLFALRNHFQWQCLFLFGWVRASAAIVALPNHGSLRLVGWHVFRPSWSQASPAGADRVAVVLDVLRRLLRGEDYF